jgi:hypothetical protein
MNAYAWLIRNLAHGTNSVIKLNFNVPDTIMGREYFHSTTEGHIINTLMENLSSFKKIFAYNASLLDDHAPAACVYKQKND